MPTHDDDLRRFEVEGAAPLPAAVAEGRVEHEGARIWYGVYGAGAPVILLHGAFDNSEDWGWQVGALIAAGRRVILIDNRGRGRSSLGDRSLGYVLMAGEVLAVIDALGVEKTAVVGWSDGAVISLILAMQSPERITRVFAFGVAMDLSGVGPDPVGNPLLGRVFGRAVKDYARLSETPEAFEKMAAQVEHMMKTEPNYAAGDLAGIRVPVAIAAADGDEFIIREHSEYLAGTIPGAELIVLPEVTHFAMLQRPDVFNAAMLGFLGTE
jgi:pimeloyl-ACP methyl ester carboxylesterase